MKSTAWSSRTVRSPFDHVGVNVTPAGTMFTNSEVVSIGSLKFTQTTRDTGIRPEPFTGFVSVTHGAVQIVSKLQGFGAKPGTSGNPVRLIPDVTRTVYRVHWLNGKCAIVRSTFAFHWGGICVIGGLIVHVTLPVFISSLNAIRMSCVWETSTSPSSGNVAMMLGLSHRVMNCHGLGAAPGGPAMSGLPSGSVPVTVTSYFWQIGKFAAWVRVRIVFPPVHVRVTVIVGRN